MVTFLDMFSSEQIRHTLISMCYQSQSSDCASHQTLTRYRMGTGTARVIAGSVVGEVQASSLREQVREVGR